ncbi:MAG TPA: hypothetical protein PLM33_14160, partial [Acidobacteriota bacterium]|nr:hypothetical protein [Acidobacteriota bacterium]
MKNLLTWVTMTCYPNCVLIHCRNAWVLIGGLEGPRFHQRIEMAKESIHKKLERVRPPRVHITYDVEV